MSIAYTDTSYTRNEASTTLFFGTPRPGTKLAASALILFAAAGSTTAGVPIKEPFSVVGFAHRETKPAADLQVQAPNADAALVRWVKEQSGLTWDQIARAFDVSRRAVHLWANGGRVSAGNAEALQSFAALIRGAARSSSAETRNTLLSLGPDGLSPIDRFRRAQHAASIAVTGVALDPATLLGDTFRTDQ